MTPLNELPHEPVMTRDDRSQVESPSPASLQQESVQKQQSNLKKLLGPVLAALTGIAVLLYPVVITQLSNIEQRSVANTYVEQTKDLSDQQREDQLEKARQYNESRAHGPIMDPWLARVSGDNFDYQEYAAQLNLTDVMANVAIPAIDMRLPVYHGTGDDVLDKGVGHLYGSDLPVGGIGTHAVLTGHTGLRTATLFDNLDKVKVGDAIYIQVSGETLKYQVEKLEVVLPNEAENLYPVADKDLLTLVTCTPYGINSHRLLVHAERVPMDEKDVAVVSSTDSGLVWQWWMIAAIAVTIIVIFGGFLWIRSMLKKARNDQEEERD